MSESKIKVPADGQKITMGPDGRLQVPDIVLRSAKLRNDKGSARSLLPAALVRLLVVIVV